MKKRLLSALILIIIIVPIIYFGSTIFSITAGLLSVLAMKEMFELKKSHVKIPAIVFIFSAICLLFLVYSDYEGYSIMYGITYRGLALTMAALLLPTLWSKNYETKVAFYCIGVVVMLGVAFNGLILMRMFGLYKFIYIILIPVLTDTFAFIVGKLIGKTKISKISPNKTKEGCIGGSIGATVLASLYYFLVVSTSNIPFIIIVSFILSIVAQLGDLVFSKIKRENNVKDFSDLIPGHGGILDRIDSTIFVAIIALIIFTYI